MQGLCPAGWHLPTKTKLETLKDAYTTFPTDFLTGTPWIWNATTGKYQAAANKCLLWSSTAATAAKSFSLTCEPIDNILTLSLTSHTATFALPVRCIKDK